MFSTVAAAYLGYLALMWGTNGWYNVAIKVTAGAISAWGLIDAMQYWGFVVPSISN